MMKKIFTALLVAFASTCVMAKPDNIKMIKVNSKEISDWAIETPAPGEHSLENAIITPKKHMTIILFVNKFRASNPRIHSDPVLLHCDGVPTIVNPGNSAVCVLGPSDQENGLVAWSLIEKYMRNGSDGFTVALD